MEAGTHNLQTGRRTGYQNHITGLKGAACVLIMLGHFLGLYKYAQQFEPGFPLIDSIRGSCFSFLLNEGYWLYLFFVISGYLIARSEIKSMKDVIFKIINRFFRFAFPILFAYLVIFMIYLLVGFHTEETTPFFRCDWYQNTYLGQYTFTDVLFGPIMVILGKPVLNSPYWVLRDMFISSVAIYGLKYGLKKFFAQKRELAFSILMTITVASMAVSQIITACLIGMVISLYCDDKEIITTPGFAVWSMIVGMAIYFLPPSVVASVFFASLVIFIPRVECINRLFCSKAFQYLGKISWGIYSFHWPLICSLVALIIVNCSSQFGLSGSYLAACILTGMASIVLSAIFYHTFERLASRLTLLVSKFFQRIIY